MKYIIGNWKMHLGIRESVALARGVLRSLRGKDITPEVVICPAFTSLSEIHKVTARSRVHLGAQNCGPAKSGRFTGEVSTAMLEDLNCSFVIIGHSERREHFCESDELVSQKLKTVIESSRLTPILCVGEPWGVREAGEAFEFVTGQVKAALSKLSLPKNRRIIIAYEPLWAIGTGKNANPGDIAEMHQHIRAQARKISNLDGDRVKVVYGGSVDSENAYQFLRESEVDGLLVGGASRSLSEFDKIINAGIDVIEAQADSL
ncbi:MAG: triose-phosphate isomerase [bacterium]